MKKITLFIITLFSLASFSQENSSISYGFESNSQYYLDDSKTGDFLEPNRFRSNNFFKIDYSYQNFYAGLQVESYEPKALLNYSPNLDKTNLGLYYIGYKTKKIEFTLGHFYEQFGSGLILRSWEDRQLGINNALRGGRIKFSPKEYLHFTGFYAKQRKGFAISKGNIVGFNSDIDFSSAFKFENSSFNAGFSYVGRSQERTETNFDYNNRTDLFSTRLEFTKDNFYSNLEYVAKGKDAVIIQNQIKNAKKGAALLANFGYAKKGLGINATFRRMENMSIYSDREANGNIYNESVVNYLPALTKQHDYLLTNIYVYQAQPQVSFQDPSLLKSGEIGGQLDVYYKLKKGTLLGGKYGTKIAINFSSWHGLKADYDFSGFDYETEFFGFGEKYFSDISIEVRKKWSKQWNSIFYYVNQSYNKRYIEETFGKINANIAVGEATYKMGKGKSLRFEAQFLATNDDKKNWVGGTIEFNATSKLAVYINDIYNYGNDLVDEQIHYYNAGGSYTVGAHRFALNYGRQRGGLICIGGVCRNVPESTGISANITMSF
ncbi:DUF6029 family protein [Polaribacter sp.]|nr:DUF6029 family protein [Polaribacter sp.]